MNPPETRDAERRVLILGAGLVSRPIVRHFLDAGRYRLTVASLLPDEAEALVDGHPRGRALGADVCDPATLAPLMETADLVVSLVPHSFHARVARLAIAHGVPMVTASYVSPEMRALHHDARKAGVAIVNEVGLDPGIDHMSVMRLIDAVRGEGGRITRFESACGGLPAPEAADNPWRYKFSWSPRGALSAARLPARYLDRGRVVDVPGNELVHHTRPYRVEDVGAFQIYPNRDSVPYIEAYGLEQVESMLRATIRYPGWTETIRALDALGMLDSGERDWPAGMSLAGFTESFLGEGSGSVRGRLVERLGVAGDDPVVARLEWAGLLDEGRLEARRESPLGVIADLLRTRMQYAPGERDMVLLRHELLVRHEARPDERWVSLLVAYGEPGGDSAMSRTVSLPAAVAGELLLEGRVEPGVHIPTRREIYDPVLERLAAMGIAFREWNEPAAS